MSTGERIDPRITRTHKLLLDAFLEILAEKRFEDITIQEITARATVNRATFYAHFPDKNALVDEQIRVGFAQILQRRLATHADDAQVFLRGLFLAITDHWTALHAQCKHSYPLFESLVEAQVKAQLRDQLRAWLCDHYRAQNDKPERLELAATIVSWAIYGAALEWSKCAATQSAEAYADMALPLITAGLAALDS